MGFSFFAESRQASTSDQNNYLSLFHKWYPQKAVVAPSLTFLDLTFIVYSSLSMQKQLARFHVALASTMHLPPHILAFLPSSKTWQSSNPPDKPGPAPLTGIWFMAMDMATATPSAYVVVQL